MLLKHTKGLKYYIGLINNFYLLKTPHRIGVLEGVRGLAVLLVFNVHALSILFENTPTSTTFTSNRIILYLLHTLQSGHCGVDIFFVLSGYFIWKIIFQEKRDLLLFFKSRLLRLMPIYTITTFIVSIPQFSMQLFIANILFLPQFIPRFTFYNFVAWSLAWEWLFYTLVMLLAIISNRNATYTLLGLILLYITNIHVVYFQHIGWLGSDSFRLLGLILGCLIAQYPLFFSQTSFKKTGYFSLPILLLCMFSYWKYNSIIYSSFMITSMYFLVVDGAAMLLINMLVHSKSAYSKIFQQPPLRILGQISYSLYLVHACISIPLISYILKIQIHNTPTLLYWYLISLLVTIITSSIFFYCIERPLLVQNNKKNHYR